MRHQRPGRLPPACLGREPRGHPWPWWWGWGIRRKHREERYWGQALSVVLILAGRHGPVPPGHPHQGTAERGLCALPIAEGGHVAPGLVPQAPLACGSGGLGPCPPPVLHGLFLQEPTHDLLLPALLLLLEGAAGNAVWAESQTPPTREAGPTGLQGSR